jgi:hypothetical protein
MAEVMTGLGCADGSGPGPTAIAGTYGLVSVDGCVVGTPVGQCPFARRPAALDGSMLLGVDGSGTRTVRFAGESGSGPQTVIAIGTYTLRGHNVSFALRDPASAFPSVWLARAELEGDGLTVRYPHPADGEVVEEFRREFQ